MWETWVWYLGREDPLEKRMAGSSADKKKSTCIGNPGSIPGLGRWPGGRNSYPLQYSCLENSHGQRSLAGYSPWGCRELDMTEQLSIHTPIPILPGEIQRGAWWVTPHGVRIWQDWQTNTFYFHSGREHTGWGHSPSNSGKQNKIPMADVWQKPLQYCNNPPIKLIF